MSVLEERIQAVRDKAGLSPADKRRRIETLKRAHKATSSATKPSGPSAEARKSAAENRRKDAESRKPKTFAGRMKARNKAAVTKEQLDAYKKAGGTGGLGGLLNKANKLGSVASAIKDTRERNVQRVARKGAGERSAALNREKDAKSRTKTTSRTTTTDARERQVKKDAENAARKRSAALNREKDVKSRMKATETEQRQMSEKRKQKDATRKKLRTLLKSTTTAKDMDTTPVTFPKVTVDLDARGKERLKNAAKALGIPISIAFGGGTFAVARTLAPRAAKVIKDAVAAGKKSFKKQKAVVKGQRTREDKKTKQRFDDRKERLAKGEREKANREASRKRAEDALETGYMRGGAVRKGPEGFKGTF